MREGLASGGVRISAVVTCAGPSDIASIVVSVAGQNSIVVTPGANALLTPRDVENQKEQIRDAGMVLTQLETHMETVVYHEALWLGARDSLGCAI